MSRIGKQPVNIPKDVSVSIDGHVFTAKNSKGELKVPFSEKIDVTIDDSVIIVKPVVEEKRVNALWGLLVL